MVNLLTDKGFSFLLAKRNILTNKKNSLVIILTLSLVFAVFMMMLGVKSIYTDIFTKEAINRYQDIDLIISYDEYSPTRFINKRQVKDNYEDIDYALAFFNLQVLTEKDDELFYSNMISSLPHEFEILVDNDIDISLNKAVITESYSENYQLQVGDSFSFFILDTEFEYEVSLIIDDYGIFSGDSFFVNKSDIYNRLYSTNILDNFGNIIYISSNDYETTYQELIEDEIYQDYLIRFAVDEEKIAGIVSEYTSMIVLAGLIVLLALIIVLDSLFLIVLKDIFSEMGVIDTLGGRKSIGRLICFYQWTIYTIISFVIGILLAHIVINIGASFYGINAFININPFIILLSLFILSILIVIKNFKLLKNHEKSNVISKIKDKRYIVGEISRLGLIIVIIGMLFIIVFKPFTLRFNSLIIVVLSIYISLSLLVITLRFVVNVFSRKKTVFGIFNKRYMKTNKSLHQSLRVVFLALIVVTIMVSVRIFISKEIEQVRKDNKFDLLMVNIYDYDNDLLDDLSTYDLTQINPALLYNDVFVDIKTDQRQLIRNFVSMDTLDFPNYFGYALPSIPLEYSNNDLPYILFPQTYKIVYDLKEGDIVEFDLTPELQNIRFLVGGFIDTNFDHIVYSNLFSKLDEFGLSYNTIFINANDVEEVNAELIRNYSSKMYYVINGEERLEETLALADNVLALFTVITVFIILSFVFVVINNTILKFYALKNEIAKIKVIGYSNYSAGIDLIKEISLMLLTITIIGLMEIFILSEYLRYLLLYFNYYKELTASLKSISYGYIVVFVSFTVSYIYYHALIKHISLEKEIKFY